MKEQDKSGLDAGIMAIMQDVKYIKRTGKNKGQDFMFATAEQVVHEIRKSALKHGVRIAMSYADAIELATGETKSGSAMYRVRVKGTLTLSKGADKESHTFYGEGADFGDKATAKAMTACLKQGLRQVFLIETGESDPDKVDPTGNADQEEKIKALPQEAKDAFEWLKKRKYKDLSSAAFRNSVIQIIDANQGDPVAILAYLKERHGWCGNAIASDMAMEKMP